MSEQQPSPEPVEFDAADRRVIPASVRRAPKFGAFVATGALVGIVAGLVCGYVLPNSTGVGRGTVALLVASGLAVLGVVIAGVLAVVLDRSTPKELKAMKAGEDADGHAWYAVPAPAEPTTASTPDEPADRGSRDS